MGLQRIPKDLMESVVGSLLSVAAISQLQSTTLGLYMVIDQ